LQSFAARLLGRSDVVRNERVLPIKGAVLLHRLEFVDLVRVLQSDYSRWLLGCPDDPRGDLSRGDLLHSCELDVLVIV
jgi:hypothetical protein